MSPDRVLDLVDDLTDPGAVFVGWLALTFVLVVVRFWARWRALNRSPDPLCTRCGYVVRGLPEGTAACPECGANLRRTGAVVPPGNPRSTETLALMIQWTIFLPISALILSAAVAHLVAERSGTRFVRLNTASERYTVIVDATGSGFVRPVAADELVLNVRNHPRMAALRSKALEVEPRTLRYRDATLSAGAGGRPDWGPPLDEAVLLEWFKRNQISVADAQARAEMAELLAMVTAAAGDAEWDPAALGLEHFQVDYSYNDIRPRKGGPSFRRWAAGFWLLVWAWGVWRIRGARSKYDRGGGGGDDEGGPAGPVATDKAAAAA